MDTHGTKIIVQISEVSLFHGENNMYLYKVGTQSNVLINQVSFKRGSTVDVIKHKYRLVLALICFQDPGFDHL